MNGQSAGDTKITNILDHDIVNSQNHEVLRPKSEGTQETGDKPPISGKSSSPILFGVEKCRHCFELEEMEIKVDFTSTGDSPSVEQQISRTTPDDLFLSESLQLVDEIEKIATSQDDKKESKTDNEIQNQNSSLKLSLKTLQKEKENHLLDLQIKNENLMREMKKLKSDKAILLEKVNKTHRDFLPASGKIKMDVLNNALTRKQSILIEKEKEIMTLKMRVELAEENLRHKNKNKKTVSTNTDKFEQDTDGCTDFVVFQLNTELEDARKKIEDLEKRLHEKESEKDTLFDAYKEIKVQLEETEDKYSEAVEKIGNMRTEITSNDELLERKNELILQLERTLEDNDEKFNLTCIKLKELTEELKDNMELFNETSQMKAKLENAIDDVNNLCSRTCSLELLQKNLSTQLNSTLDEITTMQNTAEKLGGNIENLETRIIRIETLQESLTNQILNSDLVINLAETEICQFQTSILELSNGIAHFKTMVAKEIPVTHEVAKTPEEITPVESNYLRRDITDLSMTLTKTEAERDKLKAKLKKAESQIRKCYNEIESLSMAALEDEEDSDRQINLSESFEKFEDEIYKTHTRMEIVSKQLKEAKKEIERLKSQKVIKLQNKKIQCTGGSSKRHKKDSSANTEMLEMRELAYICKFDTELLRKEIEFRANIQKEYQTKVQSTEAKCRAYSAKIREQEQKIKVLTEQQQEMEELNESVSKLEDKNKTLTTELEEAKKEIEEKEHIIQGREEELVDLAKMMEKESLDVVSLWRQFTVEIVKKFCDGFCTVGCAQGVILKNLEQAEYQVLKIENEYAKNINQRATPNVGLRNVNWDPLLG